MDTHIHHLHNFLHTGSGLYNPLQQSHIVSRPHILYNISTTLYNTLQHSTTLYSLQLYSSSTVYNLYNIPLSFSCPRVSCTHPSTKRLLRKQEVSSCILLFLQVLSFQAFLQSKPCHSESQSVAHICEALYYWTDTVWRLS